jgi:hypothetical protein
VLDTFGQILVFDEKNPFPTHPLLNVAPLLCFAERRAKGTLPKAHIAQEDICEQRI